MTPEGGVLIRFERDMIASKLFMIAIIPLIISNQGSRIDAVNPAVGETRGGSRARR